MTFTELTTNPVILPTDALCDFLKIEKGVKIDFFKTIEAQLTDEELKHDYANFGHYVALCDGGVELFSNGIVEATYFCGIDIFRIVKMFLLQNITLEPTSGDPYYEVVTFG
jgi:hypothetical protein